MTQIKPARAVAPASQLLLRKIEASLKTLSPNDRRLADHLLSAYPDAAWQTVEEVARRSGVSKSAVVRFANRLDYDGFVELQKELQVELSELVASPLRLMQLRAPPSDSDLLETMAQRAIGSLGQTINRTSWSQILQVAKSIISCPGRVHVVGFRKSAGIADYLHHLLHLVLPKVTRVRPDSPSLPEELLDIGPDDVVIAIMVRRYARATVAAIDRCREAGAHVITITDTLAGPATPRSHVVLVADCEGISLFDSSVPLVFLVEAVVNAVAALEERAGERLRAAEKQGQVFNVFESIRGESSDTTHSDASEV